MTTTRRRAPSPGRRPSSPAPLTPDNVQAPYMKPSLVIPLLCFLLQQALAFYVGLSPAESGAPPSVLAQALRRALAGGIGGAIGGAIQVLTMMWLRTAMNVQYRDGGSLSHTLRSLYKEVGARSHRCCLCPCPALGRANPPFALASIARFARRAAYRASTAA